MSQITIKELRSLIAEHVLGNTTPDFIMIEALDNVTASLRQSLMKFILQHKSTSKVQRQEAIDKMDEALEDLRKDMKQALEERLAQFMSQV
jgi:hypothetical protein